ncbi:MAG: hypothetical protein K6E18_01140, partial [Lachnospiraceae bacterium]|nr:hypothetical protein [Lachnospiraceae bacterium]
GFIGSLIFPNSVLDTIHVNMQEEEGEDVILLPLSYEYPILYRVDTQGRPLQGVQPGIHKRGWDQQGQRLRYTVFVGGQIVSENVYEISEGFDEQFVYLPFADPDACTGKLEIAFLLEADTKAEPEMCAALEANHTEVKDYETVVYDELADEVGACSLKGSLIYSHNTYPLLYDMRILTFLFLAVSMTLTFKGRRKSK